ncbi:hypothetical protein P7K49_030941 [Saguinus oedipus]|uniref:Uncharacterized protein n=1 Tax=Saguinus oedipus TaxID=9490 RepID=A0ABQ9U5L7_SAGOE|nr:hypothetical protein P7K49_030941 [Saguinus oedipus]
MRICFLPKRREKREEIPLGYGCATSRGGRDDFNRGPDRPLQRGQNRVTAAPSPCTSGAVRATALPRAGDWPVSLTCFSRRHHRPDTAPKAERGQLTHAYWKTDKVPQYLASSLPSRDEGIVGVTVLVSGKAS